MRLPNHQCDRSGCRRSVEPNEYQGRRICAKHAAEKTYSTPYGWVRIDRCYLRMARLIPGMKVRWTINPEYADRGLSHATPWPHVEPAVDRIVKAALALQDITGKNASTFITPLYGLSQHSKDDFSRDGYMQTMQLIAVMMGKTLSARVSVIDNTRVFCTRTGHLAIRYDGETRRRVFRCDEYRRLGTHMLLGGDLDGNRRTQFLMERHAAHCDRCGKEAHGSTEQT